MLEVGFRFLPVNTGLGTQEVNARNPIFRAKPNLDYTYSKSWDFKLTTKGRVNTQGFINQQDYTTKSEVPLLAVIGDSYVEALMVLPEEKLQARLAAKVKGAGRIYSFAFSGAPLSQYLIWAQHTRDMYKPDAALFVIVGNDFDESLMKYKSGPGFHHLIKKNNDFVLKRVDYAPGLIRLLVRKSALLRYLVLHLHIQRLPGKIKSLFTPNSNDMQYVNNVEVTVSNERLSDSIDAIDYFLKNVNVYSGLPNHKIMFVVDGIRQQIYSPNDKLSKSYAALMFEYFINQAQIKGFNVVNLHDVFTKNYKGNQKKFESVYDSHWDGYGHKVASEEVQKSDFFIQLFPLIVQ